MYYVTYVLLFITALIFTLLSYWMHFGLKEVLLKKYGNFILVFTIFVLVSTVIWFILASAVIEIEIPYQFYNSTGNFTVTGYQVYGDSTAVSLVYLFQMFAVIQIVFGVGSIPFYVFDYFKRRYMDRR